MSELLKEIQGLKTPEERAAYFDEISVAVEKDDIPDAVRGLIVLGRAIINDYRTLAALSTNAAIIQAINDGVMDSVKARENQTRHMAKLWGVEHVIE